MAKGGGVRGMRGEGGGQRGEGRANGTLPVPVVEQIGGGGAVRKASAWPASRRAISGWVSDSRNLRSFGSVGRRGEDYSGESRAVDVAVGAEDGITPPLPGGDLHIGQSQGLMASAIGIKDRCAEFRQLPRDQALAACHTAEETEDFHSQVHSAACPCNASSSLRNARCENSSIVALSCQPGCGIRRLSASLDRAFSAK